MSFNLCGTHRIHILVCNLILIDRIGKKLLHLCLKILHIRACPIQDVPDRGLSNLLAFLTDQSHQPDCQRLLILTRHLYHAPFILHCFV